MTKPNTYPTIKKPASLRSDRCSLSARNPVRFASGLLFGLSGIATFAQLQAHLIEMLRLRVSDGEVSERRLARQIGVSQPHLHNVLKGIRSLSVDVSDTVMERLNLTVLDLLGTEDARPLPGPEPIEGVRWFQLLADAAMEPEFSAQDLILPDFSAGAREVDSSGGFYWVRTPQGECVRGVCRVNGELMGYTASASHDSELWQPLQHRGQPDEWRVLARITWHCRGAQAIPQPLSSTSL